MSEELIEKGGIYLRVEHKRFHRSVSTSGISFRKKRALSEVIRVKVESLVAQVAFVPPVLCMEY